VSTAGLENLITAHQTELQRPGVLSVRPGYEITDGWLTGRRAIVATVTEKLADPPAGQALPEQINGVPVDDTSVLVSSQNWSTAGTLQNRDAGVIITHPDAATYYTNLFLHDWNNLAQRKVHDD